GNFSAEVGATNTGVFAAGSNATGSYTVNLSGTHSVGGLAVEEGSITLSGSGTLNLGATPTAFDIASGSTLTIPSVVSSTNATATNTALTKSVAGTLVLSTTNTYVGKTLISAARLSIDADRSLGAALTSAGPANTPNDGG